MSLSDLDDQGRARMVDVSDKPTTARQASASGTLLCATEALISVREGRTPKGGVIATAKLAGVMGAKRTAEQIPLCHPLPLTKITVTIAEDATLPGFQAVAEVRTHGPTGVEMEALTAISTAYLTLFDMLNAVDRAKIIGDIRVTAKSGGRSGG